MEGIPRAAGGYDEAFDVAVVGYGFAGSVSALEAARAGARVLLVEKTGVPGGISICSYGSVRCAMDAGQARRYLAATNGGRTPEDVTHALADGMAGLEAYVRGLARVNGAEIGASVEAGRAGGNYPLPGFDTFYHATVISVPGFDARAAYPWANGAPGGPKLFKVLDDNLANEAVAIRLNTRGLRLLTSPDGSEVRGIAVAGPGGVRRIEARRGVILASGGFEGSARRQDQFWEGRPVLPAAARHNTGDGIAMAQDLGADLWHMWHFHGAYGFRSADPDYPYGIRVKRLPDWRPAGPGEPGGSGPGVKMAWILLDRGGRRYMNEYPPYTHDTGHRQMQLYDTVRQDYPRIPSALVCDENGRRLYPLGQPTSNDEGVRLEWSADNLAEVEAGVLRRAGALGELAAALGLDPAAMQASVARWNELCAAGRDEDFGRPPGTMAPIDTPPFYGAPIWPVVSNTQGGPVHDARQRIVNAFGGPIPRLYAAGELGSAFGHLYLSGGNIAECFVSGRIAGAGAAALPAWG